MKNSLETSIKKEFLSFNLDKAYFFSGADSWRKNLLIKILEKSEEYQNNPFDFIKKEVDAKSLSSFLLDCDAQPMQSKKKVAVLKRAEKLKSAEIKDLLTYAQNPPDFLCLIVLYDETLRKNDPIIGLLEQTAFTHCSFHELNEQEGVFFIKEIFNENKRDISNDNARFIYEITGGDSARLQFECDKIISYAKENKEISKEDIQACSSLGKEENPYEIIDAIVKGNGDRILEITQELIRSNAEPVYVLSIFTSAMEKVFKMATLKELGFSNDFKLAYSLGIFYREMNDFNRGRSISRDKAYRLLMRCAEAENLLKTSSGRDPSILLKNIAYEIKKSMFF